MEIVRAALGSVKSNFRIVFKLPQSCQNEFVIFLSLREIRVINNKRKSYVVNVSLRGSNIVF